MNFTISCATGITENEEKVLIVLQKSDRWLSAEEVSEITGIPILRVKRALRSIARRINQTEARKQILDEIK